MAAKAGKKAQISKKHVRFPKYLKLFIVLLFVFVFCAAWIFDTDITAWPFGSVVLGDSSSYLRYLSYNRGTDFSIFSENGLDSDDEQHNYFAMTATPKTYKNNGITVLVNKNGSVTVKGVNEGTLLEIPLNSKAKIFPEGIYNFYCIPDSSDDISDISVKWVETIVSEDTSEEAEKVLAFSGESGEIECVSGAQYTCVLNIPAGTDISDGVTFYPLMVPEQTEILPDALIEGYGKDYTTSYLRAIYPYESKKYGKVFTIEKKNFLSLSDKEWSVFQNNIRYLYFPKYAYVSILFEDGTGIQFDSQDPTVSLAGKMDSAGVLVGTTHQADLQSVTAADIK